MRLDVARLCLDCEEVHDEQHCPTCGSEAFAFIKQWVPPSGTSEHHRPSPDVPARAQIYGRLLDTETTKRRTGRLLAQGALGLGAIGLAGLIWGARRRRRSDPGGTESA